jgi:CHAT domain-containing protein
MAGPFTGARPTPLELPQPTNYLAFFEDRALAFNWHLSRWELGEASWVLEQKREVFELSDSKLIHLRLRVMAAVLAYYHKDWETAASALAEQCVELAARGLLPELWQAKRVLAWCFARLRRPEVERQALVMEAAELLEGIADSLAGGDRAVFLLNKWTAEEEFIASEVDALVAAKRADRVAHLWQRPIRRLAWMRHLNAVIGHIDDYHRGLAERTVTGHEAAAATRSPRLSLLRRMLTHERKRATLMFLQLPDRLVIITMRRSHLDLGVTAISRSHLRETVRQWHELVPSFGASRDLQRLRKHVDHAREQSDQVTARLSEALQLPAVLRALPSRVRALTIMPDDCLHGVPFAALRHDSRYLAERYALSISYTAGPRARPSKPATRHHQALLVAVTSGTASADPLPNAVRELDQLQPWFVSRALQVTRLGDATASKAAVIEALGHCAAFHIACHGSFRPDRPDESGLLLVPASNHPELLSLRELSRLDLRGLRHATLSSCWSADNFILPGRRIIGLPETLWRAGAESVLACLWPVSDELAVGVMKRFYDYLEKVPRDEALRRAQVDCIAARPEAGTSTAAPFYWAGFTLYGDPSRF